MDEESDDLRLIPRSVRDKLDRAGVKLHLAEWEKLSVAERRALVERPCDDEGQVGEYRAYLVRLVTERTGRQPDFLEP